MGAFDNHVVQRCRKCKFFRFKESFENGYSSEVYCAYYGEKDPTTLSYNCLSFKTK